MYKVLIADDESLIREGLTRGIDWNALRCEVVGEVSNGIEAIAAIEHMAPHIVITDIRMPGKNGLQVTEFATSSDLQRKVIILSGYSDFEYARQAVQLGAFDFILKPTDYSEVINVIKKAVEAIQMEERRNAELIKFKEEFRSQFHIYRRAFLNKLITIPQLSDRNLDGIRESMDLYGMKQDNPVYIMLCKIDEFESFRIRHSEEELQLLLMALDHQMISYLKEADGAYFVPLKDDLYAIVLMAENHLVENTLTMMCEELQMIIKSNYLKLTLSFGISTIKPSILELNKGYLEAGEALRHILYLGGESIIFFEGLQKSTNDASPFPYSTYIECYKPILKCLQIGDAAACHDQLQHLFRLFKCNQEQRDTIKSICIEVGAQVSSMITNSSMECPENLREQLYLEIINCETSEGYFKILDSVICEIAREVFKQTRTQHKKIVQQVLDLIHKHYMKDITLTWISSQIHLNSSYISRLVKNECGETFTNLLTQYRIEKAKEMLKNPQNKIYEVSKKVGITDAQYFSSKFKKHTGMTPSDYRDNFNDLF